MSKYNNKKVVYAGITFDSKAERDYYLYLLDLKQRGIVDVKGMVTKDFAIKQKLFEYKYPALRLLLMAVGLI